MVKLDDQALRRVDPEAQPAVLLNELLAQAAKRMVDGALENIYPIRVVRVSDRGDLVLNQGGETLSEGDQLGVYAIGQVDRDPYTGESPGKIPGFRGENSVDLRIDKPDLARAHSFLGGRRGRGTVGSEPFVSVPPATGLADLSGQQTMS